MKAALAMRKGWRAAVGLAMQLSVSWSRWWWCCGAGRRHTAQGHGRRLPCCREHGGECVCVCVCGEGVESGEWWRDDEVFDVGGAFDDPKSLAWRSNQRVVIGWRLDTLTRCRGASLVNINIRSSTFLEFIEY